MAQPLPDDACASFQRHPFQSPRTSSDIQITNTELPRRRQNRSCDQCRKGKRACDAAIFGKSRHAEPGAGSPPTSTVSGYPDLDISAVGPCSNCRRWRKECTFNWLCSVQTKSVKRRREEGSQDSKQCEPAAAPLDGSNPPVSSNSYLSPPMCDGLGNQDPSLWDRDPLTKLLHGQGLSDASDLSGSRARDSIEDDISIWGTDVLGISIRNDGSFQSEPSLEDFNAHLDPNSLQSYSSARHFSEKNGQMPHYALQSESLPYRKRSVPRPRTANELLLSSENLAEAFTRSTLTHSLLRIYRDSMENALSCWLTERTCPYSGPLTLSDRKIGLHPQSSTESEWGPNWSNRICTRVCRLDRAYSTIRGRNLTAMEEKAATRALHTAIMAFATQWTHTNRRGMNGMRSPGAIENVPINSSTNGLERSIQETCWNQANQALNDSAGIESFRVVFAHIIFSLTQRPLNLKQHIETMNARRCSTCQLKWSIRSYQGSSLSSVQSPSSCSCDGSSGFAELNEVLDSDTAPLFLETAVRQMFTYRHKLARVQRRGAMPLNQYRKERGDASTLDPFMQSTIPKRRASFNESSEQNTKVLSPNDYETFNLLFWLGVMFDTLSAVMYQRPPVVSDEDSEVTSAIPEEQAQSASMENEVDLNGWSMLSVYAAARKRGKDIWGDFFLDKRPAERWRNITRWPCSYEEAAEILSDAAPVKVLLYRRLTRLQTLIYRGAAPDRLEEAIQDTLRVYQYWNHTYGRFMLDCVAHHDSLPPRVQSWYILLAAHWHLGPILLADIIEGVDRTGIGLESERETRRATHFVSALRKENAFAVADLARCSSHGQDPSFAKAREFHDAVNARAFLTEPWTAVLVRSFARAGYILLEGITAPSVGEEPGNIYLAQGGMLEETRRRCGFCIDALWCLGKKSDMAFLAARALSDSLDARLRQCKIPSTSIDVPDIQIPNIIVPDIESADCLARDDILYPLVGSIAG